MHLQINPHDEAPVYRQIQLQIGRAIADRQIHPVDYAGLARLLEYHRP